MLFLYLDTKDIQNHRRIYMKLFKSISTVLSSFSVHIAFDRSRKIIRIITAYVNSDSNVEIQSSKKNSTVKKHFFSYDHIIKELQDCGVKRVHCPRNMHTSRK